MKGLPKWWMAAAGGTMLGFTVATWLGVSWLQYVTGAMFAGAYIGLGLAATSGRGHEQRLEEMRARKDAAYLERNQVVAALARLLHSRGVRVGVTRTDIPGWNPEWHGCIYIDLPEGQCSWHFHDSQAHYFDGLPRYEGEWDGHDTPEKYRRLNEAWKVTP